MKIRIEDNFEDVLGKAAAGLGLSGEQLAAHTELTEVDVGALLHGKLNKTHLRKLAPALQLDPDALVAMAENLWYPEVTTPEGFESYNTPCPVEGYAEMTVNSYLVWNTQTKEAIAFDTGASADMMLADLAKNGLRLKALFLTHTHWDHVAAFDQLLEGADYPETFAPEAEPHATAEPVKAGDRFEFAGFTVEARLTDGHSPGGTTYVIEGLSQPLAIVGDSIFCLSQGGAPKAYGRALENNRRHILSLPPETILCPGHGPLTTVRDERARNPFFPEFKVAAK